MRPALDHESTLPIGSEIETIVLLKDALIAAMPCGTFFFSFFFVAGRRVPAFPFAIVFLMVTLLASDLVAEDAALIGQGSVQGWVVNESNEPQPCEGINVVLRVRLQGQFVPV